MRYWLEHNIGARINTFNQVKAQKHREAYIYEKQMNGDAIHSANPTTI